jgi:Flp pilus assembly protein TadD
MPNLLTPGALRRLLIPALSLSAAMPALAQMPASGSAQPSSQSSDPAELLARALRTLATEPSNLQALTAAGHNALILGDPNAAVGFFGRAQEIAPNDGGVKAGLGSALVQLEKPQDALRLFAQASRLGVPDADLAEDRGLAYDLTGDQARAQADYRVVLAARPDDDTARRRLALSQGISGQKSAAIATLDPLIRKRDVAAWRAQTFVLAMDGDAKGASDITRVMLPQQATMLQPFLVRLGTLSPAEKARAVHFGEMPATGATYTPTQVASVSAPATYAAAPPRSDLAPMPAKTVQAVPTPTQVATAAPKPIETRPSAESTTSSSGPASSTAAPLAQIALTTATSTAQPAAATAAPLPPGFAPSPAAQAAQAAPLRAEVAGPPAPPLDELPTPAAQGHYDLPHDAATKVASRPARPAPAPVKTVGRPVVHGKPTAASADASDAATGAGSSKKPVKTELASADDSDAKPAKAGAGAAPSKAGKTKATESADLANADDDCAPVARSKSKAHSSAAARKKPSTTCAKLASADEDSATASKAKSIGSAKARLADADDADCAPVSKLRGKGHAKASTRKKASTACTKLASTDADSDTGSKSKSVGSAKARLADADDADCAPVSKAGGKSHAKAGARKKPSTACTKLASADDSSDTGSKPSKGAKSKASTADDADEGKAKSSRSSKSAKAEKGNPERVYVQVAGGANKDDMDKAWAGVKKKAPELMKGHSPATTPLRATNRLLIGPFKDDDEAQAFVNKMAAKGLSGFTFKSSKGQKVEKIDTGK